MRTASRSVSRACGVGRLGRIVLALLVGALAAGCGVGSVAVYPPPPTPNPLPRSVSVPTDCDQSPTTSAEVDQVLSTVTPGQRICLIGRYPPGTTVSLDRSGTSAQPIEVQSDGAQLGGINIDASNVLVQGFNLTGGSGIKAQGDNLTIVNNDVRGAAADGILCAPCTNSRITGNRVIEADGVGVVISGSSSVVRDNDVSRSVMRAAPDADGIGFAGTGLTIQHNYVHDISGNDYPPEQAPHADCFRTSDGLGQVSRGVLLADNVCANVAGRCLTADGTRRQDVSAPEGTPVLRLLGNYCQSGAEQAVELVDYPEVLVSRNTFSADYRTAVAATQGSTGVTVTDNTLVGGLTPFTVDQASAAGLEHSGNVAK